MLVRGLMVHSLVVRGRVRMALAMTVVLFRRSIRRNGQRCSKEQAHKHSKNLGMPRIHVQPPNLDVMIPVAVILTQCVDGQARLCVGSYIYEDFRTVLRSTRKKQS